MKIQLDTIQEIAESFWSVIDKSPKSIRTLGLSNFPGGSCGDASNLLGTYLKDIGIEGFKYVCGYRKKPTETNHAWLQSNEIIVDITAGQFEDSPEKIIVSQNSIWHLGFTLTEPSDPDFRSDSGGDGLNDIYDYICKNMPKASGHR